MEGTLDSIDPEYFHISQLIEKSDVYSFHVIVAELLTGKMALSFDMPETDQNLAVNFVSIVNEDHLLQILVEHIVNEDNIEQLKEIANLAKWFLNMKARIDPL